MSRMKPLEDRFWAQVRKDNASDCWIWTGSTKRGGYGQIGAGGRGGKNLSAHRVSLEIVGVNVPADRVVMHHCDNPACVNPDHLSVATQKENIHDMYKKCRENTDMSMLRGVPRPGKIIRGEEHWHFGKFLKFCKRGHEFTDKTTIVLPDGHRRCRVCHNERSRLSMQKIIKRNKAGSLSITAEK